MKHHEQEWDWPPDKRNPKHHRPLYIEPEGTGWASPKTTNAISWFWWTIRMIFAAGIGLCMAGLIQFIIIVFRATH